MIRRKEELKAPDRLFALSTDIYYILRYEDTALIGCISDY
ncbi:hypothetical protein HMPREF9445_02736 [Bacteroides clarus YIT 12056]|uniref:Uncharacterized protein n=1 Tax=Bacteroides clarus YIT 12056 TaxID=762984 RepID=A0ABN0CL51_9BACE|nr:hypothetical protein HMPREF9445_02736 [Bacteroides clarus YIT 12056]